MFDISKSKFYSEIMAGVARFFGKDAENTTEAELHEVVTSAGTLQEMKDAAIAEASQAVTSDISAMKDQLSELSGKIEAAEASIGEKSAEIDALKANVSQLNEAITEKDSTISAQEAKIAELSGELASLKAGKPVSQSIPPNDPSIPIEGGIGNKSGANVMTFAQLNEMLN